MFKKLFNWYAISSEEEVEGEDIQAENIQAASISFYVTENGNAVINADWSEDPSVDLSIMFAEVLYKIMRCEYNNEIIQTIVESGREISPDFINQIMRNLEMLMFAVEDQPIIKPSQVLRMGHTAQTPREKYEETIKDESV